MKTKASNPYEVEILETDAVFSDDRAHRYRLWRIWDHKKPERLYIMLNPSTADEKENDPTVERCFRRAIDDGFGKFTVCNIFALRSTDPKLLYKHADPIGPLNDETIMHEAESVHRLGGQVVCAWGSHGYLGKRGKIVLTNLLSASIPVHVFGMSQTEQPLHPLYIAYDKKPYLIYSR